MPSLFDSHGRAVEAEIPKAELLAEAFASSFSPSTNRILINFDYACDIREVLNLLTKINLTLARMASITLKRLSSVIVNPISPLHFSPSYWRCTFRVEISSD